MIEIKNVSKKYGDRQVYRNFSLSLEEGKITTIVGESGCGKTTLLNMIAGLTSYEGEISNISCSYIFQQPRLIPNLTVKENLQIVCTDENKIQSILKELAISSKANQYPIHLSGGEAQRVAIARAFICSKQLLLMDEPFVSLDIKTKVSIMKWLKSYCKHNKQTALFVTHDLDEAIYLADQIFLLKDGFVQLEQKIEQSDAVVYGGNAEMKERFYRAFLND